MRRGCKHFCMVWLHPQDDGQETEAGSSNGAYLGGRYWSLEKFLIRRIHREIVPD